MSERDGIVHLDGRQGEGGGQVLRSALAVSVARGRGFVLEHVRARRTPPGLKAQHLEGVRAAAALSGARVVGATPGSSRVDFMPTRPASGGEHRFAIGTAGATSLLLHAVAFPLWLAGGATLTLLGGTHVEHAPGFDYLALGWAPVLARAGFRAALELARPGFFPKGGGEVRVTLEAATPVALDLAVTGGAVAADVVARSGSLPHGIAGRLAERAAERLARRLGLEARVRLHEEPSLSPGCALTVALELEGGGRIIAQALGERGKRAERVADEAVDAALADLEAGGSVDEHLADQLLVPLALGAGGTFVAPRASDHLTTNVEVLRALLPGVGIALEPLGVRGRTLVRVEGSGRTPGMP